MKLVYADAGYWIAMTTPTDALHQRALALTRQIGSAHIVTCEMVLTELLDGAASRGNLIRGAATRYVTALRTQQRVRILLQTPELFEEAFMLYTQRPDKAWGLTDCASIVLCQREGITDVLTYDHHFTQAGLNALLREI